MRRWLVPAAFLAVTCGTGAVAVGALVSAAGQPSARHFLVAVYWVLRTAVAFAFAVFTASRAEPHRRSRELSAFVACGVAMLAVVAIAGPTGQTTPALLISGDAVAVAGCLWLLGSVLALGRCFGLLPEARGLVTRGPYRVVRHPVYLGEITAIVGLTLAAPAARNVVVLAALIAAQIVRSHLEERALGEAFPEYASYAARTGRLLPMIGKRQALFRASSPEPAGAGHPTA
jgi:protein-S-isoprenylcysteine O-methyltransferase Ste14